MSAATSASRLHRMRQRVLLDEEADRLAEEEEWEEQDCLGSNHTA